MKYIITWVLIKYSLGACPPQSQVPDEFSRVYNSNQVNAVACVDRVKRNMQKEFGNRDSAISFYKKIKNETGKPAFSMELETIDSVKIDSIKLVK